MALELEIVDDPENGLGTTEREGNTVKYTPKDDYCDEIYDLYCTNCTDPDYEETWMVLCTFDACAASGETLDDTTLYPTLESAFNEGFFDGAIQV